MEMPTLSNTGENNRNEWSEELKFNDTYILRKKYSKDLLWGTQDINFNDVTKRTKQVHDHLNTNGESFCLNEGSNLLQN